MLYNKFSNFLKNKYGEKVYKIPVNINTTCPNRDGKLGFGGCIFCSSAGAGFESLPNNISVKEQIERNINYIGSKYSAQKYIIYFQNFTNTYIPLNQFQKHLDGISFENIVAIYISTRPDCIGNDYLEYFKFIKNKFNLDIVLEYGLQSISHKTLKWLNRGHSTAQFIDAVLRTHSNNLEVCVHYILDIPKDTIEDVIECAKVLSALKVEQVKCHSLYILKNTVLGKMYQEGLFNPLTMEEFIERCISFLEFLSPQIVIQRLIGRAPKDDCLFCSWNTSWRKIQNIIEQKMLSENRYQGKNFKYLEHYKK